MQKFTSPTHALGAIVIALLGASAPGLKAEAQTMWYAQPATDWMQSLPIGNGRVGAQVWGETAVETLSINESSMWSGFYNPDQAKVAPRTELDKARQSFFEGNVVDLNSFSFEYLQGNEEGFGTHLPLGDLKIAHRYSDGGAADAQDYRRELNLCDGTANVSYNIKGVQYTTSYFSSNPDDVVVVHYCASQPGAISFDLTADLLRKQATARAEGHSMIIEGVCRKDHERRGGVNFYGRVGVTTRGGTISANYGMLSVEGADEATLIIDLRTDYSGARQPALPIADVIATANAGIDRALATPYAELRNRHTADFSRLFGRVALTLGDADKDALPTDRRWLDVRGGADDPALQALFFQYGRYLTMSSSRENSPLPIALQGFFNDNRACSMAWNNDYHLDINTQQNYWITGVGNLAECNAPLYTYLADLAVTGHDVVKRCYGIDRGWTAHTTANVWGYAAPSGAVWWGLHPTGGSWMATHLWEDYAFSHDRAALERGYPILKGNAEFLLDFLTPDPRNDYLVSGPSISPENSFGCPQGHWPATMMPTCDRIFITEIFNACIEASRILDTDHDFARQLQNAVRKLPPFFISPKYGTIQEWMEDYDDINPNHRHTTHLLGVFPYSQITLDHTPELCEAAERTVERRLNAEGWEDTEWSRAMIAAYYARLHKADKAYESINTLIGKLGRENLLTVSPEGIAGAPYDIFSFDGNPAGAAAIAELLLQSHEGYVSILPALPTKWASGSFSGLCVRGGAEVSAQWTDHQLTDATLHAKQAGTFRVLLPGQKRPKTYRMKAGQTVRLK